MAFLAQYLPLQTLYVHIVCTYVLVGTYICTRVIVGPFNGQGCIIYFNFFFLFVFFFFFFVFPRHFSPQMPSHLFPSL